MLNKLILKCFKIITPQYGNYARIVWSNKWHNLFRKKQDHKYLFILSPPYCGSTLLNELISTSNAVSVNNHIDTREGQRVPTLAKLMFHHERRWDPTLDYDWRFVKKEWLKYWDLRRSILLEKSPPNIVRAQSIEQHFSPSFFIIFNRNPYAHCESLIRRNQTAPEKAAQFAIQCLTFQKQNIEKLKSKQLHISYEMLTENTKAVIDTMVEFLPELHDMDYEKEFSAKNQHAQPMKISNLNPEKIKNLNSNELDMINAVFYKHKPILDFFGYQLMPINI